MPAWASQGRWRHSRWRWLAESLERVGWVEAQAAVGAAEADGAELAGVGVDPVALDAEHGGEGGGVHEPRWSAPGLTDT